MRRVMISMADTQLTGVGMLCTEVVDIDVDVRQDDTVFEWICFPVRLVIKHQNGGMWLSNAKSPYSDETLIDQIAQRTVNGARDEGCGTVTNYLRTYGEKILLMGL